MIFPEARLQVVEYRNGNERENSPRKVQTTTRYGNLVLRRGVIGSLSWYQWWDQVRNGDTSATRTLLVQLQNEDHGEVVLTWKFPRARPVSHQFSPLNGLGDAPFMEILEVAFESLVLVGPSCGLEANSFYRNTYPCEDAAGVFAL